MEVTLTDALKALGITENQVLSSRDAGDRFIVVTKPTGVKHTIMKVSIKPETTVANITEVTPAELKPVTKPQTKPKAKVLSIKKKVAKITKKVTKKKKK